MLTDKIAFVTGATRGIGRAIALQLGNQGATVIGTATSTEGADKISAYLAEAGLSGKGIVLEVCDAEQLNNTLSTIAKEFGAITILVNNAGITRDNLTMGCGNRYQPEGGFSSVTWGNARHDESPFWPYRQYYFSRWLFRQCGSSQLLRCQGRRCWHESLAGP